MDAMESRSREQPSGAHRFGAERRLRRRSEFQRVFDNGSRVHGRFLTVIAARNQVGWPRLGIVASRKIGDAVRRNRAKRLIREVFRRSEVREGFDLIVIPRREFFDAVYSNLDTDFRSVLKRCALRLRDAPPSG